MKRFLPLLLSLAFFVGLGPGVSAATPNVLSAAVYDYELERYGESQELSLVDLRLNDQPIVGEMPAVILGGRTMAPLRLLAESLGAEVEWISDKAQVLVVQGDNTILLTLGSAKAQVNGLDRELPDAVPATTISYHGQGYTMVPLRFFSETLGCRVDWNSASYTASVTQRQYIEQQIGPLLEPLDRPVDPSHYLIALDPGHGGAASGAYYEETAEKDLNLAMAKKVEVILNALGYRTLVTRREDVDVGLYERSWAANWAGADIFVSIHCNASDKNRDFQGTYVYHYPGSEQGLALAQSIQAQACAFTGSIDRGTESANFVVVRESYMPAVLVETGFMTCHEELERLQDNTYQIRMAQGIVQGIIQYLNARD